VVKSTAESARRAKELGSSTSAAFLREVAAVSAMPAAEAVLSWATGVANEWRWLAIVWHIALGGLLVGVSRSAISQQHLGLLLVLPIVSVAVLALESGNTFNAAMFAVLAAMLLRSATHLPRTEVTHGSRARFMYGLIGVFWLGVMLDIWLLAGASLLGGLAMGRCGGAHSRRRPPGKRAVGAGSGVRSAGA
jgi:hypothetical protein